MDVSRALDGSLVRHRRVPGHRPRVWAEDVPPEAPLDTLSWDALKTRVSEGQLRPGGPYRPERG